MRFKLDALASKDGWDFDGICEICNQNKSECTCKNSEVLPFQKHKLHARLEKRNGKPVTVILPFYISYEDLKSTLSTLKKSLACGGAINDNTIELQGDVGIKAKDLLKKNGFGIK